MCQFQIPYMPSWRYIQHRETYLYKNYYTLRRILYIRYAFDASYFLVFVLLFCPLNTTSCYLCLRCQLFNINHVSCCVCENQTSVFKIFSALSHTSNVSSHAAVFVVFLIAARGEL